MIHFGRGSPRFQVPEFRNPGTAWKPGLWWKNQKYYTFMETTTSNKSDVLRNLPIFRKSPESVVQELARACEKQEFSKNDIIFQVGDPSSAFFILVKGSVKIGRTAPEDREVIKQVLHPITLFGELGLVGEESRLDFAQALSKEVIIYRLEIERVHYFMKQHHQLAIGILEWVGNRLRNTEDRLEALIFKDARQRIIDFIKDSARKRGRKVGFETLIKHSLTQQDIANITGTSRQTVTSVLNDLRKSNLIYFNRRSILIRDMAKLS